MSDLKPGDLSSLCYFATHKTPESFTGFEAMKPALEREHPQWMKAYRKLRKAERNFAMATDLLNISITPDDDY